MEESAKTELKDCCKYVFFDEKCNVLASNFTVVSDELKPLTTILDDRDEAIKQGMVVGGTRYEVHRHHPPLVYGRTMTGQPENSEGIALCKVEKSATGGASFGLITYQMPNISARMVPILQRFCGKHMEPRSR
ncbi:hypothetical protein V8C86DRAFT_279633 [Haematococcus lacustris]